ncbi:glycine-rich protein [Chengkuizengella axinellae]|uniref:Glycine-rich protein n=1 Tax=Chengkuizengella axinellae TaxID=3064388 RepID=A0ABT9J3B6_9BACL|nr:glycine-rich protein [Chengkuizengella sp. 2205SS18-9]MDP5276112.1 glycine-rich protein [Chengkuizengella sp. 2205SS18-9]
MFKKIGVYFLIFIFTIFPLTISIAETVGTNAEGQTTYTFSNTSTGRTGSIQSWTVPQTAEYQIETWGAEGGRYGGQGAYVSGTFELTEGDTLKILVGQEGSYSSSAPSGGGGTFVVTNSNTPLIVAGGGGGSCYSTDSSDGKGSYTTSTSGGNKGSDGAPGGGGFNGNGDDGDSTEGGFSFLNGGKGGIGDDGGASGGFGGGGGGDDDDESCSGPGGGGGYKGGNGGGNGSYATGGYSYNAGENQSSNSGINYGHGQVVITQISEIDLKVLWDNSIEVANNEDVYQSFNGGFFSTWTVPSTGNYRIKAYGAEGGYRGGGGAYVAGTFYLTEGEELVIMVGRDGEKGDDAPSGGGGTFVTKKTTSTRYHQQTYGYVEPLIVAGGGGGSCEEDPYSNGSATHSTSTSGGKATSGDSGGGGGFAGDGEDATADGGHSFLNGGSGGDDAQDGGRGGFGGGGGGDHDSGSCQNAAGGGGYHGGDAAGNNKDAAQGGFSYNVGSDKEGIDGYQSGDGKVIIEKNAPDIPLEENVFPTPTTVGEPIGLQIHLSHPEDSRTWDSVRIQVRFVNNDTGQSLNFYSSNFDGTPNESYEKNFNISTNTMPHGVYTVYYRLIDQENEYADKMQRFSNIMIIKPGIQVDFSDENEFPSEWEVSERREVEFAFKNEDNKTFDKNETTFEIQWLNNAGTVKHEQTLDMTANLGTGSTMRFTARITSPSTNDTYTVIYRVINNGIESNTQQEFYNIKVFDSNTEWRIFDFSLVDENLLYWTGRRFDSDYDITIDSSGNPVKVTVEYRVPLIFPIPNLFNGGSWEPVVAVSSTAEMKIEESEF